MKKSHCYSMILLFLLLFLRTGTAAQNTNYAALTFDDGPTGRITEELLDGLRQRNIKATFFLCCYRMEQYPHLVQQMAEDGHEIGIHGCSHDYFTRMSREQLQNEIRHTADNIRLMAGVDPTLLRPPGGLYNKTVLETAASEGLSLILWSLDPEDWDPAKRKGTANYVAGRITPGDIVLLHDLSRENVSAALDAADRLTHQGWQFVTVSRLAELSDKEPSAGNIYRSFR